MFDFAWFDSRLSSSDFRSHWWAAVQLMNVGADGLAHLPRLLDLCERFDHQSRLTDREESFILYGARSSGRIVHSVGYSDRESLHQRVANWIMSLVDSPNIQVAAAGTWGMGELGVPPASISKRLHELIGSDERFDATGKHSLRSIAFRMLARIDRDAAAQLVESTACHEYIADVRQWIAASRARPANHYDREPELLAEAGWLLTDEDG
ncbi:hypothetical protein [Rubripirellula lacrimiformis]|nr:hypothetical protein [Rubripirellula lacrimiformis]